MLERRPRKRIYCWMRQQRIVLAAHKFIYYRLDDSIFEDLQFDYLEKRLEVVERRYPEVALALQSEGYFSPSTYVDTLDSPGVENRARRLLDSWIKRGRPRMRHVPMMSEKITNEALYLDALQSIVRYPI